MISGTNPFLQSKCSPVTQSCIAEWICTTAECNPTRTDGPNTYFFFGWSAGASSRNTHSMRNDSGPNWNGLVIWTSEGATDGNRSRC